MNRREFLITMGAATVTAGAALVLGEATAEWQWPHVMKAERVTGHAECFDLRDEARRRLAKWYCSEMDKEIIRSRRIL